MCSELCGQGPEYMNGRADESASAEFAATLRERRIATVRHRFEVHPAAEGGYVAIFPELPGCMTRADTWAELGDMVADAYALWIESNTARGIPVPPPIHPLDTLTGMTENLGLYEEG